MATATRSALPTLSIPRLDNVHYDGCPCCAATRVYAEVGARSSPSKRLVSSTLEYHIQMTTPRLLASSTALPTPISPIVAQHRWPLPCPSADYAGESCSVVASACRPPSVLPQASAAAPSETASKGRHDRALAFSRKLDHTFDSAPVYKPTMSGISQSASCSHLRNDNRMSASLQNDKPNALYTVLLTPPTSPLERLNTTSQLPTPLTPSSPLSSSRRGMHHDLWSSEPSARVKTPDVLKSRPLEAIHGRDRSLSMLFTLPNETLSHILSFLPLSCLPPVMRVCSRLHALCERALYHTLQHIQLYSPPDAVYLHEATLSTPATATSGSSEWGLIHTLATRPSAARSVRHFAIRGLPCFGQDGVVLLARALNGMQSGLVSLEINLGIPIERALVRALSNLEPISAEPQGFVNLAALNVLDTQTALWVLGARHSISSTPITQQHHHQDAGGMRGNDRLPSSVDWNGKDVDMDHDQIHAIDRGLQTPSARSPLSVLRIDFQHPLDAATLDNLLNALVPQSQADSRSIEDVEQLQLGLQCRSADEASAMASTIARRLPTLRLLGLHVYPCSPEEQVLDFMATSYDVLARSSQSTATGEKQMETTWDLSTSLNDALSHLPLLHTLSFAYSLPFTMGQSKVNAEALAYHSTLSTLHDHATPCGGSLNLIELQWSAWQLVPPRASASLSVSRETKHDAVSHEWTAMPANWHQFIRLGWAYANASFV